MTHEERLGWCRKCTHRQSDLRATYVCGLTGNAADFEGNCPSYVEGDPGSVAPPTKQTVVPPPPPPTGNVGPPPVRQAPRRIVTPLPGELPPQPSNSPFAPPGAYDHHDEMERQRNRKKGRGWIIGGSISLGIGLILIIFGVSMMGYPTPLSVILAVFGIIQLIMGLAKMPS